MNSETLEKLAALDSAGFLIRETESAGEFLQRVEKTEKIYADFEAELVSGEKVRLFDLFEVSSDCLISPELTAEAAGITEKLYGFSVRHVPGFYLTKQVGLLWGGCMIGDPEENFAVFLLRDAFRKKAKFLNYRREELLAHELCHSVRQVLDDPTLEEYFAYQTSPSGLRRYLGNCFISGSDALFFLLPVMLLPIAELLRALWNPSFPSWIFWIIAVLYPLYLLWRNFCSRLLVGQARKVLAGSGCIHPEAVLFRCTPDELLEIGNSGADEIDALVRSKAEKSVRWQVIEKRFFRQNEIPGDEKEELNYEN